MSLILYNRTRYAWQVDKLLMSDLEMSNSKTPLSNNKTPLTSNKTPLSNNRKLVALLDKGTSSGKRLSKSVHCKTRPKSFTNWDMRDIATGIQHDNQNKIISGNKTTNKSLVSNQIICDSITNEQNCSKQRRQSFDIATIQHERRLFQQVPNKERKVSLGCRNIATAQPERKLHRPVASNERKVSLGSRMISEPKSNIVVKTSRRRHHNRWEKHNGEFGSQVGFLPQIIDNERCRARWKLAITFVKALLHFYKKAKKSIWMVETYVKQKEHIDQWHDHVEQDEQFLLFDPSEFKATKQTKTRLSTEAMRVLQKEPRARTQQEIQYTSIALRRIKRIGEYPLRTQQKLAQYGRFERFGPGRVIMKQFQTPHAFYFILYGTVVVAVVSPAIDGAETKCFLHHGDSFGEVAIVNGTSRQSTVITKTTVELMSIDVEAYKKIFMVRGIKNLNDPDHQQFVKNLPFLQNWPVDQFRDHPEYLVFTYFKHGQVMVKDSNFSDWIYIIKSGSVGVLKKLTRKKSMIDPDTGKSYCPQNKKVNKTFQTFKTQEYQDRRLKWKAGIFADRGPLLFEYGGGKEVDMYFNEDNTLDGDHDSAEEKKHLPLIKTDPNPEFVRIQVLIKGDVFGPADLVYTDQPSLCLVSNGAECIMMKKEVFRQYCSEYALHRLRVELAPYPTDDQLEEDLQHRINWDAYRQATMLQCLASCKHKAILQSLSQQAKCY